jgi:DNA-binding NarL/FixJ family response regulator
VNFLHRGLDMSIKVLLVDDHSIVRQAIACLLNDTPDIRVVGESGTGAGACAMAFSLRPDVVVLDVGLPDLDGEAVARRLTAGGARNRVVALSVWTEAHRAAGMMEAGAIGHVAKDCAADELLTAIRRAAVGERYISPSVADKLLHSVREPTPSAGYGNALTPREREVLALLADGHAMKEAAVLLRISTKTIETHRRTMMEKLQLFSVASLTKHAIRCGLTKVG